MTISLLSALHPLVSTVDQGGGWLYDLLTKLGVDPDTARTVVDFVVRPLSIGLVALVAFIVARIGERAIRRLLDRVAEKAEGRAGARTGARVNTMSRLAANIWRFFVVVIAVAIILGMLGIDLGPLLASATIIGATLGFGAQQIVRDYISGFLMTVEDQYSVGDAVTLGYTGGATEAEGTVEDVTLRLTKIRRADGTICFIPNGDIRLVANISRGWARARVDILLPGSSAAHLDQVRDVLTAAAQRVSQMPEFSSHNTVPPKSVHLVDADTTSLTMQVTLNTVPSKRDALTQALREAALADLSVANLWPGQPVA